MAKATPPRPAPTAGRAPARAPENTLSPLRITYYRRMHRQYVYTVTVGWSNKTRPAGGAKPVMLRLLMAGAQVVPSEQALDPARPDASVDFYVTPLARGHLRSERLEVLVGERKVQEVALPCKVTSQRFTLFLLAMTFLVPWFVLHYGKYSYLVPQNVAESQLIRRTPGAILEHRLQQNLPFVPDVLEQQAPAVAKVLTDDIPEKVGSFYDLVWLNRHEPLAVYAFLGLLFLTLICWFTRRGKRKRRIGPPIPLPAGGAVPVAADEDED